MASPDEQFEQWARRQSYESQRAHYERRLDRLEWSEILAYLLIFVWVVGMFVAFQLGWMSAYLAALVTIWVVLAGGGLVWYVRRQQSAVRAQIIALDAKYADSASDVDTTDATGENIQ